MLKFIKELSDNDFFNLLVSVSAMRYGDRSRKGFEYSDTDKLRHVHVWDNYVSFKDRDETYFTVDDYNISRPNNLVDHHLFMLHQFGDKWYESASKHFANEPERLEMLAVAKDMYAMDLDLGDAQPDMNEINS